MKKRRILFFIYDGFELLDLSGPLGVFNSVNTINGHVHYQLEVVSEFGGNIRSSGGVVIGSISIEGLSINYKDTILVTGALAPALSKVRKKKSIIEWLTIVSHKCERLGSVCSGAFILAETGLLDNKVATTHWSGITILDREYPNINVDKHALYINDGKFWTSAGVTTGIDMALELVRRDYGSDIMGKVAKGLVVYAHRPGHQSQFSQLLTSQAKSDGDFSDLLVWINNNLHKVIRVNDMSEFMHMSQRTFQRRFSDSIGVTPSKFIEQVRLSRAKELLDENMKIKLVLHKTGFNSEATFRQLFKANFGITPGMYKRIHGNN